MSRRCIQNVRRFSRKRSAEGLELYSPTKISKRINADKNDQSIKILSAAVFCDTNEFFTKSRLGRGRLWKRIEKSHTKAIRALANARKLTRNSLLHHHEERIKVARSVHDDKLTEVYGQWRPFWKTVDNSFNTVQKEAEERFFSYSGKEFAAAKGKQDEKQKVRENNVSKKYTLPKDVASALGHGLKAGMAALEDSTPEYGTIITDPKCLNQEFKKIEDRLNGLIPLEHGQGHRRKSSCKTSSILQQIFRIKHKELRLLNSELNAEYQKLVNQFAATKKLRDKEEMKQMQRLNTLMTQKATGWKKWGIAKLNNFIFG